MSSSAPLPDLALYVGDNGQQFGPYRETEIATFVQRGQLTADSVVRRADDANWTRLGQALPALFPAGQQYPSGAVPSPQLVPGPAVTGSFATAETVAGWSWAAFLWGPIWAVAHRVWWGLLGFIPGLGFIVHVCLALFGRKQAWDNRAWRDTHHMHESERRWVIVWLAVPTLVIAAGIVAGVAGKSKEAKVDETMKEAKVDETMLAEGVIYQSLQMYRIHNNTYPPDLHALLTDPGDSKGWRGPYIEATKLKDPWGHDFKYESDGHNYRIVSSGPDGKFDTKDDIVYPEDAAPIRAPEPQSSPVEDNGAYTAPSAGAAELSRFTCRTSKHTVLVDDKASNGYRYRAWNAPRAATGKPDLELTGGSLSAEGTGQCRYYVWTFQSGGVTFRVNQMPGCTDGSEPAKAIGQLEVTKGNKELVNEYCMAD